MTDFHTPIIATHETPPKNRFPVIAQLGILLLILTGIFASLVFVTDSNETKVPAPVATSTLIAEETTTLVPQKIEAVSLEAAAAYVWDVRGQRALYAKNEDAVLPLASITKLMTALLAYELVEDELPATMSLSAIRQEGASGLRAGEVMRNADLRELALVSSSNDAAYQLAASVGTLLGDQDAEAQFVRGMNIRAEELGLSSLEFKNTTGLDLSPTEPGAVGSARDVSFLMEHIVEEYPEVIAPTQQSATRIYNTAGAYHEVTNTNQAAPEIPNMIGSKTGFTDLAGGNLTVAFDAGLDRPIIITVLGSTRDERFSDMLKLVQAAQATVGQSNP
jgi:D-alanyl-D-alanine carboxypeptidase (penicillin-binding protein 5/6)